MQSELTGITKRFDDVVAVDNIDLTIADGEFFAMLGPSGCGKTTTLRMIAGLEFPTQGSLKIFGDEVGTLAAQQAARQHRLSELRIVSSPVGDRQCGVRAQDAGRR